MNFSKILTEIEIFENMTKIEFFFFEISTEIKIFGNFRPNPLFFENFD